MLEAHPDVSGPVVVELILHRTKLGLVLREEIRNVLCRRRRRQRRQGVEEPRRRCRRGFGRCRRCRCRALSSALASQPLAVGREADAAVDAAVGENVLLDRRRSLGHHLLLRLEVRVHLFLHGGHHRVLADRRHRVVLFQRDPASGRRLGHHRRSASLVGVVAAAAAVERPLGVEVVGTW